MRACEVLGRDLHWMKGWDRCTVYLRTSMFNYGYTRYQLASYEDSCEASRQVVQLGVMVSWKCTMHILLPSPL